MVLNIEPRNVLCPKHGEIFIASWPAGYLQYIGEAMSLLLRKEEVTNECNRYALMTGQPPIIAVQYMLAKRTLCCLLMPMELYNILKKVNEDKDVWKEGLCVMCGTIAPGARCRKGPLNGGSVAACYHSHVCLACVCGVVVQENPPGGIAGMGVS